MLVSEISRIHDIQYLELLGNFSVNDSHRDVKNCVGSPAGIFLENKVSGAKL